MGVVEFWNTLCDTFGYRFFSGVPNDSLSVLFNSLNEDVLHFVPAVSDSIAVGVVTGAVMTGQKGAVLCSPQTFSSAVLQIKDFVLLHKIPVLFIGANVENSMGIRKFDFLGELSVVSGVVSYIYEEKVPAVLNFV
jgi:sulfopyruvate decarboxylase TPP-binding subunit